ncbi:urease accessory protein UreF [Parendozoicomonas haliclonae]|uniref:Urease accessory protein UreF n=1 Tax=Parendozoicomonas haliclonae TaxID=1960125 RepID=A0A1X7AHS0_9GAMM|nr:urease accessory UreF family protein [Parendozoicomonas haliclonae]SMA41654.1 Urease accessory protein UreF [Parendozoicomonas haliclonae]
MNLANVLSLLHISSPSLPIGAFAYSQGLETAIDKGWCHDEQSTGRWIRDLMVQGLGTLDIPMFRRLYQGWEQQDREAINYWNDRLLAFRETKELFTEDCQVGRTFQTWHRTLHDDNRVEWLEQPTVIAMYTLACVRQEIPQTMAATGFLWSWCENQVASASKAVPLGQTAAQRVLQNLITEIEPVITAGFALADEEIGNSLHHYAMASSWHEQQYSRLFRS